MAINGIMTSIYLQLELVPQIDKLIIENPQIYKSRNSLINAAIMREIRRVNEIGKPQNIKVESKEYNYFGT